jgi:DNA (cytosine-5)-methyltransferase 1
MSKLVSFSSLGTAHNAPRFWIEGPRLAHLGFSPGSQIEVQILPNGLNIVPAVVSDRIVSSRRSAGTVQPIIDLNSHRQLGHLVAFEEMKVIGTLGRLHVTPSVRGFNIRRSKMHRGPYRVLDVGCGGGTMTDGFKGNQSFSVVAGIEINPVYAAEFAAKHRKADVIVGDFRRMTPEELPEFDILAAGIPCTDHSDLGKAKKNLGGRPEIGELGDLFVHMLGLVAARLPSGVVFENVENYGRSLAGMTVVANLKRLGYHVEERIIEPNLAWNEPTTRNRWVCIATLRNGFNLRIPLTRFEGHVADYLDEPDLIRDSADAERIAKSIVGLRAHNVRHKALGHDFSIRVLNGRESAAPTVCRSYHKINSSGFFVETMFGPRMLRKNEIARLHGQSIACDHYATAVAMMGQGVLTRVFKEIFRQLGEFMEAGRVDNAKAAA